MKKTISSQLLGVSLILVLSCSSVPRKNQNQNQDQIKSSQSSISRSENRNNSDSKLTVENLLEEDLSPEAIQEAARESAAENSAEAANADSETEEVKASTEANLPGFQSVELPTDLKDSEDVSGQLSQDERKKLLDEILSTDTEIEKSPHMTVPIEVNASVLKWIHYFTKKDRERFQRFINRGNFYRDLIESILAEESIPKEVYYLGMIESGYSVHARSHAKAVGPWQFMRGTGLMYGLKVDNDVDERRDIVRSTRAAAKYLKNLYIEFGSWYLAMASYNAGEGRVRKAIRKGKSHDFWYLVRKGFLPRETTDYVPKFLAASIIGKNAAKYGFQSPDRRKFPRYAPVSVPASLPLFEVAKVAGVSTTWIRGMNPHLTKAWTPRKGRNYTLWIPAEKARLVVQSRGQLKISATRYAHLHPARIKSKAKVKIVFKHQVKKGETLEQIARKYRTSPREIMKANGLRSLQVMRGQVLKIQLGRIAST